MKKLHLIIAFASLTFTSVAHAQLFSGGIAVAAAGATSYSYDPSSGDVTLSLPSTNLFQGGDGTFASVPLDGLVSATNSQITGLVVGTTTTLANPVVFEISTPFIGDGTTPPNEFAFVMTTVDVTSVSSIVGPTFIGDGYFLDNTSVLTTTPATYTAIFSGGDNYGFTASVAAAPEPSTWALLAGGLSLMACVRFLFRRA